MFKKILMLSAIMLIASNSNADDITKIQKTISTTGTCFTKVSNDKLRITINVQNTDKESSKKAYDKTKETYTKLEKYIKHLDVHKLEMETTQINLTEDKSWDSETRKYVTNGYKAQLTLTINMPFNKKDYMSKIIEEVSNHEGAFLQNFNLYVSSRNLYQTKKDCLYVAIKDAKNKADLMAKAGDSKVKDLLQANDGTVINPPTPYQPRMELMKASSAMMADSAPINIESKDQEVIVKVSTVWEIQ